MSSVLRTKAQRGIINSLPYKGRIIDIDSKYLSDSDQNKVVQVLYGRDILSTSMLFPPWNISRRESSSGGKGGGKGAGGGSATFYASIAFAICIGEVDKIYNIFESDNLIRSTDGESLDTTKETDYGKLRFYKGTATQRIDSSISSVVVFKTGSSIYQSYEVPDLRYICYAVSDEWKLGSSTSHPNIRVECFKGCSKLTGNSNSYMSDGDYAPPVILYEMLKDYPAITRMFSDNNSPLSIDTASFISAAQSCVDKGIYISVTLDEATSLADAVANILEYCDGVIYIENDTLKIRLPWKDREVIDGDQSIDYKNFTVNDMIEEPVVEYQSDDWGVTKLSFCDRALEYEETTAIIEHPDYEGIVGLDAKIEEFDRPFIKQRSVANRIAKYLANVGVKPSIDLTLNVLPASVSGLKVGDLIKVDYDKYAGIENALFRVNSIAIAEDGAEVQAVSECTEFFNFTDTDILFIERERYISMDRDFPYLYPKILVQRQLGANEINGFQNQYGKGIHAFLFVAESYAAGKSPFKWEIIDSSKWSPNNTDPKIGIEPAYQKSGILSAVFYNEESKFWEIDVSFSAVELNSVIDVNVLDGLKYYIVCSRYNANGTAACVPIIFRIESISPTANKIIATNCGDGYAAYSVSTNDNPHSDLQGNLIETKVSSLFFLVSEEELLNCHIQINLQDRNRFAAKVYSYDGKNSEKTPGYAAVFYKDKGGAVQNPPAVVNRMNDETDLISEHTVMWPDNECVTISILETAGDEYPKLVWDETAGNYYVQYTDVELSDDQKEYLTLFKYVEKTQTIGRNYQELVTTETNGSLSFNHSYGYDSLIYVTVMHSGNTLTVPSLEGVAPGDSITIIVNAVGVEDFTKLVIVSADSGRFLSRSNDNESVPINSITGSTFNVASGITTKLYCVLKNTIKYWYVDTYSGTETGF